VGCLLGLAVLLDCPKGDTRMRKKSQKPAVGASEERQLLSVGRGLGYEVTEYWNWKVFLLVGKGWHS
jgi:hypothetical protein